MADTTTLLKIAYGLKANMPASPADGTLLVAKDTHELAFKLPDENLFYINSSNAATADSVKTYLKFFVHNTAGTTADIQYNGGVQKSVYIDNKLIIGSSATATSDIGSTETTSPYIDVLVQTGMSSGNQAWANCGGVQFAGSGPITVKGKSGVITISAPAYPTALRNPSALSVATDGSGTTTSTTYNGSSGFTISYNNIGAAKASGNDIDVIDWTKNYTTGGAAKDSGANEWTIPAKFLPKEALLDVVYVDAAEGETLEAAAKRATGVEVGDFVQVNPYSSSDKATLYYVQAISNGHPSTIKEVTVGNASYAVKAGSVNNNLTIYNKNLGSTASSVVAFNGGSAKTLYIQHGLISTNSATATTKTATTGNNGAFINSIMQVSASDPTAAVDGSVKIVGGGNISVNTSNANVITISYTQPTTLPNANALAIKTNGTDFWSYTGGAARSVNFVAGTGLTITPSSSAGTSALDTITFTPTAYTGTSPIVVSNFAISHAEISGLVASGNTTATVGPSQSTAPTASASSNLSLTVPKITMNKWGHISSASNTTYTISFPITQGLTEGDVAATILGTTIYCGVTWDTF